ncbi:hypothetical protein SVA_1212 [Sulfurifustis variabilis]|uniref:Uncharacterized protein n=1 Tax=Sulfurifustis variabilis TaxID=1675686 RepID=A0A1B4VDD6_9GAMM|nr:hypothetical protein [Sulfurifustis variabilis]BAU47787.1 hypothetical protein SVA_1212 [Sulfurifustis variabilis]
MATSQNNAVEQLYQHNIELYTVMARAQGVPREAKDWIFGNAMANTLFDINQKIKPVGLFGTLAGKVTDLKEQFLIEVVPFAHMPDAVRDKVFVDYCRWSRFDDSSVDISFLASAIDSVLAEMDPRHMSSLVADAERYNFKWLEISAAG